MDGVTGIGGVFFRAKDPAAIQAWYQEHLGIPVEPDGYTVFRWQEQGGAAASTVWAPFPADTDYFGESGSDWMVNFRVRDLDALLTRLREEGVTIADDVQETEQGRFCWIVDPEGNRIELWEPAPGL